MERRIEPVILGATSPDGRRDLQPAMDRAVRNVLSLQHEDGHWCGELEADSVLESEYILLLHFLGRSGEERARKAACYVRRQQLSGGAWAIYQGGPPEVSASVKAYFVLKLLGDDPDASHMAAARRAILDLGGIEATNTYTKIYLAMFGQYPWDRCPAIPPEMMLLPRWAYFNAYEMSSWSRGIFVPLAVLWAYRPVCAVPDRACIPELLVERASARGPREGGRDLAGDLFRGLDRGLKMVEGSGVLPLRKRALRAAERWILARLPESDGLGAIFPAIVNAALALLCLGYDADHPAVRSQLQALERHEVDLGDALRIQPAMSPVWDTGQAVNALALAGLAPDHPALMSAASWLLDREVRVEGDWKAHAPDAEPGGWYFEYENAFYPDCDDTAKVLIALSRVWFPDPAMRARSEAARGRGVQWLLGMQNRDGGWGAFDRACDKDVLRKIPFADHNAMLDPSWEDVTGRVLEALSLEGFGTDHSAVRGGLRFLEQSQCEDGTWYGRWGCNYIYGTWLALWGLRVHGVDLEAEPYRRSVRWLFERQNEDGGWGETLGSYDDPALKGRGASTAAQTAWALLGLHAAGEGASEAAYRGLDYLLSTQRPDGSWNDEPWTGTGFPQVFYLRYHLYDDYFPLLALAAYRSRAGAGEGE